MTEKKYRTSSLITMLRLELLRRKARTVATISAGLREDSLLFQIASNDKERPYLRVGWSPRCGRLGEGRVELVQWRVRIL